MAKNPNSMKKASSYAERLQLPIAIIHGEDKLAEHDTDDGRTSPPLHESTAVDSRITSIDVHNLPGNQCTSGCFTSFHEISKRQSLAFKMT